MAGNEADRQVVENEADAVEPAIGEKPADDSGAEESEAPPEDELMYTMTFDEEGSGSEGEATGGEEPVDGGEIVEDSGSGEVRPEDEWLYTTYMLEDPVDVDPAPADDEVPVDEGGGEPSGDGESKTDDGEILWEDYPVYATDGGIDDPRIFMTMGGPAPNERGENSGMVFAAEIPAQADLVGWAPPTYFGSSHLLFDIP